MFEINTLGTRHYHKLDSIATQTLISEKGVTIPTVYINLTPILSPKNITN